MVGRYGFDPERLSKQDKDLFYGRSVVGKSENQILHQRTLSTKNFTTKRTEFYNSAKMKEHPNVCCHKVLINPQSPWKSRFDKLISIIIIYTCLTSAFFVAFKEKRSTLFLVIDWFVDVFLIFDFIAGFFIMYYSEVNSILVKNLGQTAKRYVLSYNFFVNLITCFLWHVVFSWGEYLKLLRLLRLNKATNIFSSSTFEDIVVWFYSCRQKKGSKNHENMRVKYIARYCYRIINLILFALVLTYFCGCFWYMISDWNPYGYSESFAKNTQEEIDSSYHRLIICCYFALTTLSTVGYGDLTPQNNLEKIIAIVLMIVGIAFFSYIMGNFNDVLITYDEKMGVIDRGSDLQVWLTNLSKFTSQKPLPRSLVKKIDKHFRFYWNNDRLSDMSPDDDYLQLLPRHLRFELITYLFEDIFQTFRGFFLKKEFSNSYFFYELAFCLLPRKVSSKEVLVQQGDDVNEIYFLLEGEVKIEFESEDFGKVSRYFSKGYYFGDYYLFFDKPADYNFIATTPVQLLALPKIKIQELSGKYKVIYDKMLSNSIKNNMSTKKALQRSLKTKIEEKMTQEGDEMSQCSNQKVIEVYERCVKQKAEQIRNQRIRNKNRDLYRGTANGKRRAGKRKMAVVVPKKEAEELKEGKLYFNRNLNELEEISRRIDKLKAKLEKTL